MYKARVLSELVRRGGRVAEGARLESVFTGNRNVGSNPTPSASPSDNRVLFPGGLSSVGLCWRGIGDQALYFGDFGLGPGRSLMADFL